MKKILFFAVLLTLLLPTVGCNDSENNAPLASILFEEPAPLPAEGGNGVIRYSIVNPLRGARLSATSDAEWLSVGEIDPISVACHATPNPGNEPRTARVTLHYPGALSRTVEWLQEGMDNLTE